MRLWNMNDSLHGQPIALSTGLGTAVYSVKFAPNGNILAAASTEGYVFLWDITNPSEPRTIGSPILSDSSGTW